MSEETKKPEKKDTVEALEARLQELQAELDREKLKNLALNTMIEVAEEELQIDIRKKPGAKQYAEDGIILDLIAEYRKDMGRLGGRNDSFHIGRDWLFDARRRIAEVIDIYNNKRPHTSLNYSTPREAHKMHGEQVRRWKNYYKTNESPEKNKEIILSLTTGVRTPVQASGF